MSLWGGFGHQLQHPRGVSGRLTGMAMSIVNREPNRLALSALQVRPGDTVLELGFGPGEALADLTRAAFPGMVHGVDQSKAMIERARARNSPSIRSGLVRLHQARFEALPLADASVDKVLAVNVIYFWTSPPSVMSEIGRVLRPGGRLAVYATHASAMRGWPFARSDTHELVDEDGLRARMTTGPFDPGDIQVWRTSLRFGISGLIGVAVRRRDRSGLDRRSSGSLA